MLGALAELVPHLQRRRLRVVDGQVAHHGDQHAYGDVRARAVGLVADLQLLSAAVGAPVVAAAVADHDGGAYAVGRAPYGLVVEVEALHDVRDAQQLQQVQVVRPEVEAEAVAAEEGAAHALQRRGGATVENAVLVHGPAVSARRPLGMLPRVAKVGARAHVRVPVAALRPRERELDRRLQHALEPYVALRGGQLVDAAHVVIVPVLVAARERRLVLLQGIVAPRYDDAALLQRGG